MNNLVLPIAFKEQTESLIGEEEYNKLHDALQQPSPVSIRLNESKYQPVERGEAVPWCATGRYLTERLTFTFDPLFHAGCYYVQEASSMFLEQALQRYVTEPCIMLDLCAAPGGKSTHALSVLPQGSLLVANEVIRNRSQILAENLMKWGHPNVVVTNNDPSDFAALPALFDVVLTDVPCSGEGMFRKDPNSIAEWSTDGVNNCYQRQRRILADCWDTLKPGGLLIYSTCTYNTWEDEENIAWIIETFGAEPLSIPTQEEWGISSGMIHPDAPVYRFFPHKTKGEGFFLAVLRKPYEVMEPRRQKEDKRNKKEKPIELPAQAKLWLTDAAAYHFEMRGDFVSAFPQSYREVLTRIAGALRIVHSGVLVGEVKGRDLIPHHSLAMSCALNRKMFLTVELVYTDAIAYLRKEAITLDGEVPRGYVLLLYKGMPLGFAKNIGNRANNLYPNEWRIRSGYLPEEVRCI